LKNKIFVNNKTTMYQIYCDNASSPNKGKFELNFEPGIEFPENSTMALTALSMYNSIYNISEFYPNNLFYIYRTGSELPTVLNSSREEKQDGENWLYTITLPNGQYSLTNIDTFIAKNSGDWDTNNNILKDYMYRNLTISGDSTTSRFNIDMTSSIDVLFKVNDTTSNKLAYLMGLDMSIQGTDADKITIDAIDYWSLRNYKANRNILGNNGFQVGEIMNGLRMINLKIKNNVIDGGYDSQSRNSDTVFAFAFSVSPGSIEVFNPTNPVHLNILATNQALGKLQFEIQDQSGNSLNQNISEIMSFTLTIDDSRMTVN
jgi:hypothetical protein